MIFLKKSRGYQRVDPINPAMVQAIAFHSNNPELQAAGAGVLRLLCSGHRLAMAMGFPVGYRALGDSKEL